MSQFVPCLVRCHRGSELESITLGHRLLDDYLAFVAARARTNTWLAVASDLKIFFSVVAKEPTRVTPADVFGFLAAQRAPRRGAGADQHVAGGGVGFEDLLWRGRHGADTGDAGGCVGVLGRSARSASRRRGG